MSREWEAARNIEDVQSEADDGAAAGERDYGCSVCDDQAGPGTAKCPRCGEGGTVQEQTSPETHLFVASAPGSLRCGICDRKPLDHARAAAPAGEARRDDGRDSLAQEIRATLAARGLWAPANPADLISAVGKALDDLRRAASPAGPGGPAMWNRGHA